MTSELRGARIRVPFSDSFRWSGFIDEIDEHLAIVAVQAAAACAAAGPPVERLYRPRRLPDRPTGPACALRARTRAFYRKLRQSERINSSLLSHLRIARVSKVALRSRARRARLERRACKARSALMFSRLSQTHPQTRAPDATASPAICG